MKWFKRKKRLVLKLDILRVKEIYFCIGSPYFNIDYREVNQLFTHKNPGYSGKPLINIYKSKFEIKNCTNSYRDLIYEFVNNVFLPETTGLFALIQTDVLKCEQGKKNIPAIFAIYMNSNKGRVFKLPNNISIEFTTTPDHQNLIAVERMLKKVKAKPINILSTSLKKATLSIDDMLFDAVENNDQNEVLTLILSGANVNASKTRIRYNGEFELFFRQPVIHLAFGYNCNEKLALPVIRLLLDAGADINARDEFNYNWTILMHAAYLNCPEIVKTLIERGANTELMDDDLLTVFEIILNKNDYEYHKVFSILTNETDDGRKWLLSLEGKQWIKAHQIDKNAPITASPAEITNLLRNAMTGNDNEALNRIIKWVNSDCDLKWKTGNGWTLLHITSQCGNEKLVRFLVQHKANIESRDKRGFTPLILACAPMYSDLIVNPDVVNTLLDLGANPNAMNLEGRTALSYVFLHKEPKLKKIAQLLEDYGAKRIPGVSTTCPECGAPETRKMKENRVEVTFSGVFAVFYCPNCFKKIKILLNKIDTELGLKIGCSDCDSFLYIPSLIYCVTCKIGLKKGWEKSIAIVRS